jgi:hypothetical protein
MTAIISSYLSVYGTALCIPGSATYLYFPRLSFVVRGNHLLLLLRDIHLWGDKGVKKHPQTTS